MTLDTASLQAWCGKPRESVDVIAPGPVAALSAALDHAAPAALDGEPLPPCWHWLFFHEHTRASQIGEDGHPARGGFLPPVPLPRRMWAGGVVNFRAPVRIGDTLRRLSTVTDISARSGRSGELVFVTVKHAYYRQDTLCIEERQDLVYREAGTPSAAAAPSAHEAPAFDVVRELTPDAVLLFRYSALTFNGHRIHYDRDYATGVEAYPERVVQGPLTATLLLDTLRGGLASENVSSFEFRGRRPLFAGAPVTLCARRGGQVVELCALDGSGALAMSASARLDGTVA